MIIFPCQQYGRVDSRLFSDKNSIPFSTDIHYSYTSEKFRFLFKDVESVVWTEAQKIFRKRDIFEIMNGQEEIAQKLEETLNIEFPLLYFKNFTLNYFQDAQDSTLIKEYRDGLKVGYSLRGIQDGSGVDPDKLAEKVATILSAQKPEK